MALSRVARFLFDAFDRLIDLLKAGLDIPESNFPLYFA